MEIPKGTFLSGNTIGHYSKSFQKISTYIYYIFTDKPSTRVEVNIIKAYSSKKTLVVCRGVNCQLSDSELTAVKLPLSCPLLSLSILVVNCL